MRCKKLALRVLSTAAFLSIVTTCAAPAFADAYGIAVYGTYYVDQGSISVEYRDDGHYYVKQGDGEFTQDSDDKVIITNTDKAQSTSNTITIINNKSNSKIYDGIDRKIDDERDTSAKVTLDNVNINASGKDEAGMSVEGTGDVTIEINNTHASDVPAGTNVIKGGGSHAGIEKKSSGTLAIRDDDVQGTGNLEVTGGAGAAGIGSAAGENVSNILIDKGNITAKGGDGATGGGAGIGSGAGGNAENITIRNGVFDITGGAGTGEGANGGAGIGSGANGTNKDLTIINGTFNSVTGGSGANAGAGIGSGGNGTNASTTVQNGTFNNVTGGSGTGTDSNGGAGIGSGGSGANESTRIENGTYSSRSGDAGITGGSGANGGAGIGSGGSSAKSNVTITGDASGTGADGGAGVGGGANSKNTTVTIDGGNQITGNGSEGAAGIGGGKNSRADVTIKRGNQITGNGGNGGAGIGGGEVTDSSAVSGENKILIDGWSIGVTGNGGEGGAGIGSGKNDNSSEITIKGEDPRGDREPGLGADVKGVGGTGAAGIGGGEGGAGGKIALNGGRVEAEGGEGAYAIGSGKGASGSDVTVAGSIDRDWGALDVTATAKTDSTKAGEIIEGGETLTHELLGNINRTILRFCSNNRDGWFKTLHNEKYAGYYAENNDLTHEEGEGHLWYEVDRKEATATEDGYIHYVCQVPNCGDRYEILPHWGESSTAKQNKEPWIRVVTPDQKLTAYDVTYAESTVTYQTDLDDAVLTGNLAALQQLQDRGIQTVVFTTNQRTSSFQISDLLACGGEDVVFALSHTGSNASLTVGGAQSDSLLA